MHALDKATVAKKNFLQKFRDTILAPRNLEYKVQFTGPTGTNAVETALKLARMVKRRSNVIAFTNGYHGLTMGALAGSLLCGGGGSVKGDIGGGVMAMLGSYSGIKRTRVCRSTSRTTSTPSIPSSCIALAAAFSSWSIFARLKVGKLAVAAEPVAWS